MNIKSYKGHKRLMPINKKALTWAFVLTLSISIMPSVLFIDSASAADSAFSIIWITDTQHSAELYPK